MMEGTEEARGNPSGASGAGIIGTAAALAIVIGGALAMGQPVLAQSVNIDEIFWCEGRPIGDQTPEECVETRSLILAVCTSCHLFVPIVVAQKAEQQWDAFFSAHREHASQSSDADYEEMREFVKIRFNPDNPVPDLPPALLQFGLPPG